MRIIIIGAGKVGFNLAKRLSEEKHEVVLIEENQERQSVVDNYLDVLTIAGHGASPQVLQSAGVKNSDLVVAVTDIDEVNMIACMIAKHFGAKKTIARVRDPVYVEHSKTFFKQLADIDLIINPELITALEISKLLKTPAALDVEDFAGGKVQMVELRVDPNSPIIGKKLKDTELPPAVLIAAILREDEIIIPTGENIISKNDIVFIVGQTESMAGAEAIIGKVKPPVKKVMILGGGRIGLYLAKKLEKYHMDIKLIESNHSQCEYLASQLQNTLVLHGDGTDFDLLKEEGAGEADAFIALTNDDKSNFLIAQLARHLGAKKTIVKVKRSAYIPIIEHIGIDVAIMPGLVTAGVILQYVRGGEIIGVTLLEGDKAEVIEMELSKLGPYLDVPLYKTNFPTGTLIGTIVRDGKVIIPNGQDVLKLKDKVVIFSLPQQIVKIENFFDQKIVRRKKK